MLIAQVTDATSITMPASGDFWNPQNWAGIAHEIGPMGFIALMLLLALVGMVWFFVHSTRVGMEQWKVHLESNRKLQRRAMRIQATQFVLCRQVHGDGGAANVVDLRHAGHAAADGLMALGDIAVASSKTEAAKHYNALSQSAKTIHDTLRNMAPPLPDLPAGMTANAE